VLTHGFVLDDKGRKMSKSLGNGIDPLEVIAGRPSQAVAEIPPMKDEKQRRKLVRLAVEAAKEVKPLGVDTLRLWIAASDYASDVHVSPAILAHVAESLRKIRSTTRYFLGNLHDYAGESGVPMLPIDRYAVTLSRRFRETCEQHYGQYAFSRIVSTVNHFTNATLSSFYFDTLKDRLYADARHSISRRSAQDALATMLKDYLHVLAPICPSLIEEVWPHLPVALRQDAPHIYAARWEPATGTELTASEEACWQGRMALRGCVNKLLEEARKAKHIRSSLEAEVHLAGDATVIEQLRSVNLANLLLVSAVHDAKDIDATTATLASASIVIMGHTLLVSVHPAALAKCPRCWTYTAPHRHQHHHQHQHQDHQLQGNLCSRCLEIAP
jgi:isoleucyl-tRNA synthetase